MFYVALHAFYFLVSSRSGVLSCHAKLHVPIKPCRILNHHGGLPRCLSDLARARQNKRSQRVTTSRQYAIAGREIYTMPKTCMRMYIPMGMCIPLYATCLQTRIRYTQRYVKSLTYMWIDANTCDTYLICIDTQLHSLRYIFVHFGVRSGFPQSPVFPLTIFWHPDF